MLNSSGKPFTSRSLEINNELRDHVSHQISSATEQTGYVRNKTIVGKEFYERKRELSLPGYLHRLTREKILSRFIPEPGL